MAWVREEGRLDMKHEMGWEEMANSVPGNRTQQKVFGGSGARILESSEWSAGARIEKPEMRTSTSGKGI